MHARLTALLIAAVVALAVACGGNDKPVTSTSNATPQASALAAAASPTPAPTPALRGDLTVFAASSLTDAFSEIGQAFQQQYPGVTPKFNFAASTALRQQIEQGARADVFASADQAQMDMAKKSGVIAGEDRLFAKNKLVLIYPTSNPGKVSSIQDLAKPGLKFVLTDKGVPIGAYARQALDGMSKDPQFGPDFATKVLANLKSEEANVRAVVTKVQLGEADAAIVYATDVTPAVTKDVQSVVIPDQFNVIATYPVAVVKDVPNKAAAEAFVAFLRTPPAQAILKKNGFILDKDTGSAWVPPAAPGAFASLQEQARSFSPSFALGGAVDAPRTYTLADLQAMQSEEQGVEFLSGGRPQQHTYRGVRLHDLLMAAKPQADASVNNDLLRFSVLIGATDGYQVVVA
jgi:molybdate transport system substrate-binding protein